MNDRLGRWTRTAASRVPHRVGTVALFGAWVALAAVFALAGSVLVAGVLTAVHPVAGPVTVVVTAVGVAGVAVVPLLLSQRVVAGLVERLEVRAVRASDAELTESRVSFDGGARCRRCRPPNVCC